MSNKKRVVKCVKNGKTKCSLIFNRFVIISPLLFMLACSNVEFRPTKTGVQYPETNSVVTLLPDFPEQDSYQLVGTIIARGVNLTPDSQLLNQLKKVAAENGANAIILQGTIKTHVNYEGGTDTKLAAWAILY